MVAYKCVAKPRESTSNTDSEKLTQFPTVREAYFNGNECAKKGLLYIE
jgi:hypothetical protein